MKKNKFLIMLLIYLSSFNAYCDDFAVVMKSALMCNSVLDIELFYSILQKKYGDPIRKDGALWFKGNASIYNQSVEEFFISDNSTEYEFIGAVIAVKPDALSEALNTTPGILSNYRKTNPNEMYSIYHNTSSSEILWYKEKSKWICKRKSNFYRDYIRR